MAVNVSALQVRRGQFDAVVLEALRAAHVADRPCIVYAFGAASELAELRLLTSRRRRRSRAASGGGDGSLAGIDRPALNRLLDFMGHAFGGGTDVASPLRRALATLEPGAGGDDAAYAGADIILVSDGELPSPPVDAPTMARLEAARRRDALRLLDNRALTAQEVAEMLGYRDAANFTRAFRRWTGQTPSQYRAATAEGDDPG